jgi:multidrug resistance efflux pump
MTWGSRLRLVVGALVVLVVAAGATYKLNETRGRVTSDSAQIQALSYAVGTPYEGLVAEQRVEVGDVVHEGDPLFAIDSTTLTHDRANGLVGDSIEGARLDAQGRLVILASGDGTVTEIDADDGTFVKAAATLATVQRTGSLYVQAQYTLSPTEYARVPKDAAVRIVLPDQHSIGGHVTRVQVETVGGKAQAVVTVQADDLEDGSSNRLVAAGTPVKAELALRNDGVVTTVSNRLSGFLRGVGG